MKHVTMQEMVELIKTVKGSTFVKFVAETEVRLTGGKSNPYKGATKVAHVAGQLGKDYEVAVNNQLGREDKDLDFHAQAPKGKVHTDCKHFLTDEKTGTKTYLVVYPSKKSQERAEAEPTKYFHNGQEIDVELLKPTFVPTYANKSQGTEKEIIYRTYGMENIQSITLLGEEYMIAESLTEQDKVIINKPETVNI